MVQVKRKPEVVQTSFGYKFFHRSTDKVILYDGGLLTIIPDRNQKQKAISRQYPNMGLATIVFNRLFKAWEEKCLRVSSDTPELKKIAA